MTQAEKSLMVQSAKAEENKEQIIQAKLNVAANYLILAHLLKENRDGSLYKLLHCDSFDEFLGMPEIGFSRSKAYSLIQIWELYKDKLHIDDHDLLDAGNSKLLMIAPYVEKDREWLNKARLLSKSDLRLEINGVSGIKSLSPPKSPAPPSSRMTPEQYLGLVKSSPCVNCGAIETVVPAHFPRTRVRCKHPWHVIPLCYKCHTEQEGSKDWCWEYRANWAKWFYGLIVGE